MKTAAQLDWRVCADNVSCMYQLLRAATLLLFTSAAMAQGLVTPQDFTHAGAGGAVGGNTNAGGVVLPPATGGAPTPNIGLLPMPAPAMSEAPKATAPALFPHHRQRAAGHKDGVRKGKRASTGAEMLPDMGRTPSIIIGQ